MIRFLNIISESFRMGIQALVNNRLRTVLSLLGITIGIFAIISVFTLVDSMERSIRESVRSLGEDVIYVQRFPWTTGGGEFEWWEYIRRPEPDMEEFDKLRDRLSHVEAVTFMGTTTRNVERANSSINGVSIYSISHEFHKTRELNLRSGRYFTPMESKGGRNVCIIGAAVAENLFPTEDPVGKEVKISGRRQKVIGVVKKEGSSLVGFSMDNVVLLPVDQGRMLFDMDQVRKTLLIRAGKGVDLEFAKSEVRGALRSIRQLRPKEEDNFALNEPSLLSSGLDELFSVVNQAGFLIGIFSILVGGFSIANIMFVSVKERTPQIGVQKALGAKNGFVLSQFLFEAVVLCLIGGLFGLFFVFLGTVVASALVGSNFLLSLENALIGIGISVVIGLISGVIPAWVASRLDPVEAIRA